MLKKMIKVALLTMAMTCLLGTTAFARGRSCGYDGCTADTENCHNGTVYCDRHASAYAKKSGYKTCAASGCYDYAKSGGSYCSSHTCHSSSCSNKAVSRGGYCSTHKCKYSGCESSAYYTNGKYKGYCNPHAWQVADKSTTTKKNTSSKTTTTTKKNSSSTSKKYSSTAKKKVTMPDCDDYDSYEDFMDDWDGCMPDGSDAEDYWENW